MMNSASASRSCFLSALPVFLIAAVCSMVSGKSISYSEEAIKAESSIVMYEFPTGRDPVVLSVTIACRDGRARAVVKAETSKTLRDDVAISIDSYLKLWRDLEQNDIWELPTGEYWPWRELLEAEGNFLPEVKLTQQDYRQVPLDGSIVGVKIRVAQKTHGFMRYFPQYLKDRRYERILTAVGDLVNLQEILIRWRTE